MGADVALLDELAAGGPPALRLYRWSAPAVSLGRFQRDDVVDPAACARLGVEVVRRPSGGRALLHGGDLTYAVTMPRPPGPAGGVDAVYHIAAPGEVTLARFTRSGTARYRLAVVHGEFVTFGAAEDHRLAAVTRWLAERPAPATPSAPSTPAAPRAPAP